MSEYSVRIEQALDQEKKRRYSEAADEFGATAELPGITKEQANQALHHRAINLGMAKRHDDAERVFTYLLSDLAGLTPHHYARVPRDYGMHWLRRGDFDLAWYYLRWSKKNFDKLGDSLEAAVTEGFIGRYHLLDGRPYEAYRHMIRADETLRRSNNRIYELNHLIWLMRATDDYIERRDQYRRADSLAHRTGYHHRALEARLILHFPRLYEWARKRLRR